MNGSSLAKLDHEMQGSILVVGTSGWLEIDAIELINTVRFCIDDGIRKLERIGVAVSGIKSD